MKYKSCANICFDCKNAVPDDRGHGCPWSMSFEPVEGWTAKKTMLNTGNYQTAETYHITACPMFDPDDADVQYENKIRVRCIETGVEFDSMAAASKALGIRYAAISDAMRRGSDYACGYHWETVREKKANDKN